MAPPSQGLPHSQSCPALANGLGGASEATLRGVTVEGEEYVVVGVCVVVVRLIVEYAECALTLRLASHQLLTRLIDLLRKFNADTCRWVWPPSPPAPAPAHAPQPSHHAFPLPFARLLIEAGAVSLGLKTISTRHLALALRSLHLLLTIIPRLSHHFSVILKLSPVEKHIAQVTLERL